MRAILVYFLSILISGLISGGSLVGCSLFKREVDWTRYKNDVNFHFAKMREATLGRVLIGHSFYRDSRTYLRFIGEETGQFKRQWSMVPHEWGEKFVRKVQEAALDQDTSKSGEILARENFVADVNRALLTYIEQLRELADPKRAAEERPRSLFFFF
ncbi:MAG: hypothetical protein AABY86_16470 [Bdellovibrionota bacterium]